MSDAAKVLAIGFVVIAMFAAGLQAAWRDIWASMRDFRLLWRALLANLVVVPLLGLVISRIVPMPTYVAVGFLLMASSPGAPFAMNFMPRTRRDLPFVVALMLILTVSAIVFTPIIADLILPADMATRVPYLRLVRGILLYMVLPLAVGVIIGRRAERVAAAIVRPTSILSTIVFLSWVVATVEVRRSARSEVGTQAVVAMVSLVLCCMALGWLIGGPGRGNRRALAAGTSMRNSAVSLLIVLDSFPGTSADLAVIAFTALMIPMNMVFGLYQNHRMKQEEMREIEQRRAA